MFSSFSGFALSAKKMKLVFRSPLVRYLFELSRSLTFFTLSILRSKDDISVDNYLIRFHSATVYILLFGTLNITLGYYFGHSIECSSSQNDCNNQILEKYCLTEGAFTLPDSDLVAEAYPGVRPATLQETQRSNHLKYYHWVCLVFIIQVSDLI